jgi:UDPglucose--hexose-1-phosphate uridylyltransferase
VSLRADPITGELRLVAPGRSDRLGPRPSGCPFCPGNEPSTPPETGRIAARAHVLGDPDVEADWSARSFPNLFPLTDPHEVLVPSPRHVTSWRELELPELEAGLELLLQRRTALQQPGRYVHAFVNDGAAAGASLPHVHAQLVSVPADQHAQRLTAGVRGIDGHCVLCELLAEDSPLLVERGAHYAIVAHPLPRIAGALLVVPLEHDTVVDDEVPADLAIRVHRALLALPADSALNMWLVADESNGAHWYLELQPRTANLAGVELALGINVVARDPLASASEARERLAVPALDRGD